MYLIYVHSLQYKVKNIASAYAEAFYFTLLYHYWEKI